MQQLIELCAGLVEPVPVCGVDDEDHDLRFAEVMRPERSDSLLAADVPHVEFEGPEFDGFDIETDSGGTS
jgi:hypothetical protein